MLAFCLQKSSCSVISEFKTWLSRNNWPKIVTNIENQNLGLFKSVDLQTSITHKKQKCLNTKATNQGMGITTSYRK